MNPPALHPSALAPALALLLWAAPAHPVGRLVLGEAPAAVRHTFVRAHLVDGAAVTRVEQRFATAPGGEAAYRATIPAAAEVTDLVMWVGDRRAQGTILSARSAAQFDGIALLERTAVSADGGTQVVGLDLDLPVDDELLVQLEYMETLPAWAGRREYRLPLSVTSDSVSVVVEVASAAGVAVAAAGPLADAARVTPRADGATVRAEAGAFAGDGDLVLAVEGPAPAPRVRSWRPSKGDGFYAAWLPVTEAMAAAQGAAPALSVVIDLSAQDEAVIAAVRQGLEALIEALPESGLVAVAASGRDTAGVGLAPATFQGKASALAALQDVGAPVGEPGIDGGLAAALRAALGSRAVTGERPHYLLVVTDETAVATGDGARALIESLGLEVDPLLRGWVVQPDGERGDSFAGELARLLRGPLLTPRGAQATKEALQQIHATVGRPHAYVARIDMPQAGAWDLVPPRVGWMPAGVEVLQVGRFRTSGSSAVRVHGLEGSADAAETVTLAAPDTAAGLAADESVLLSESFDGGTMGAFTKSGGTSGQWHVDPTCGVLTVSRVNEIGRAYTEVPASSYTIQARMRVSGSEDRSGHSNRSGKIILMQADRHEYRRVDVFAAGRVRVITGVMHSVEKYPIEPGQWHDVRVEVGEGLVRTWVDGALVHDGVPLGDEVPDGVIGLGAYAIDSVAFDDVVVLRGTASEAGFVQGLLPDRVERAPALLWATERARQLEQHRLLFGEVGELEEALLDVGLTYRAVTAQSPLALVLPRVAARQVALAPAVAEGEPDSAAVDVAAPAAETEARGAMLAPNAPNPFNASTWIGYRLPRELPDGAGVHVAIYSASGQRVRALAVTPVPGAQGRVLWDGRDEAGRSAASGAYVYALEVGGLRVAARRMVLVR